jgi:hypothetical protein
LDQPLQLAYVITGGGGAPLYDVDKPPAGITQKVISTENFVSVKVAGKSVQIEALAIARSQRHTGRLGRIVRF